MAEPAEPLLQGVDLEREYRTGPEVVRVLRGASVAIGAGEVVALVGASGVGKSTLLHLLGALDRPTAGRVLYRGEDLFARGEAALARYRRQEVGFIFQFYNLLGDLTALENAMIPAMLQRHPTAEARERAAAALAEVGLGDRLRHRPGELSGGEQQRVAVARALTLDPKLLLADEPTGNLDSATSSEIHDLFFKINKEHGTTIVVVTHNSAFAESMPRVVRMRDGRVEMDDVGRNQSARISAPVLDQPAVPE
jgi:lipoprotein-releasing system ATP-binding protein